MDIPTQHGRSPGLLPAQRIDASGRAHVDLRAVVPLAHMFTFAPGQGWTDELPQFGWGVLGGWAALVIYLLLLGGTLFARWRSGAWQRIRI